MLPYDDLEGLLECVSFDDIVSYAKNGELLDFLNSNFYEEQASMLSVAFDRLQAGEIAERKFRYLIAELLEPNYAYLQKNISYEVINNLTEESRIINYDINEEGAVARTQNELISALKQGRQMIYLCDNEFTIPIRKEGIHYIGRRNPVVNVPCSSLSPLVESNIVLENVTLCLESDGVDTASSFDNLKDVQIISLPNFIDLHNPDYKNFCRLALGRSSFTSKEEYAELCDKLPDIPVGTATFHEADYDDEQGKFVLNPKFSMRFYDLLYDVTAGKIFYLAANIKEAKDLFYRQRKQQIFAVVGVSSDGNGLQVKTLFLKTILGNKVIYTIEKPLEKTVTSNSSSSGGLGYGLELIKVPADMWRRR